MGPKGFVNRVYKTCFINGVEIGVEKDLLAFVALHIDSGMELHAPSVRVPVLSEQRTFILPKFSMEARRLTMTFFDAMRFAPWERLMLMIAGSSCGVSPTAKANAKRKDSMTGRLKIDIDGEDGDHQDECDLQEEITQIV